MLHLCSIQATEANTEECACITESGSATADHPASDRVISHYHPAIARFLL